MSSIGINMIVDDSQGVQNNIFGQYRELPNINTQFFEKAPCSFRDRSARPKPEASHGELSLSEGLAEFLF
ncbi:unnamed protein product [Nezara viridula]|uniref:Uncharacterized protein n=1 Tax=Nezara viridula TaxID=85310 RepID=A0A9P0HM15_NEZVI|nr:unnamed protein product [Nezara viridula]